MRKINWIIYLFLIIGLGFFLRFVGVGSNPPGLYVDEAAIGYNAWSILKTARDEYGIFLPLFFRSFTTFIAPVYVYTTVIPIAIFGLSPFSVRLLSILAGTIAIVMIYFLTIELFGHKRLALLTALVFAISPWSVFFSRGAFESNFALLLLLSGTFFLTRAIKRAEGKLMVVAGLFFVLSTYTYQAERILSPLFILGLIFLNHDLLKKGWRLLRNAALITLMLGMVLEIPLLMVLLTPSGGSRLHSLRILPDTPVISVPILKEALSQYVAYHSPRNLFFDPDPDRQRSYPKLSVWYPWMVIPYIIGLLWIVSKRQFFGSKIILWLFLVSPVAASFTRDPFSALRSQPLSIPTAILIGIGIERVMSGINSRWGKICLFSVMVALSSAHLYRSVFVLFPHERQVEWMYGYEKLATKLKAYPYETIMIDDPKGIAYIELLFFLGYPPERYQKYAPADIGQRYYGDINWIPNVSFGAFQVRAIDWDDVYRRKIIVANPLAISESQAKEHFLTRIFSVADEKGRVYFNAFRTNPEIKQSTVERR